MRRVTLDDIVGLGRYEEKRDEFRRRIIALKKDRRLAVGPDISFVFENYDTVLFQIQEMLRAEHIVDLDRVRDELDVYNALVPGAHELSATMLIEITEPERIRPQLVRLIGIDRAVWLTLGDTGRIAGEFEAGRSTDEKLSAVQYVRFRFDEGARAEFADEATAAAVVIEHPNYRARAAIDGRLRSALLADLASP